MYFAKSLARNTTGPAMSSGTDRMMIIHQVLSPSLVPFACEGGYERLTSKSPQRSPFHHVFSFCVI